MYILGSKNGNLIANVFGGGEVIQTNIKLFNIGERNIVLAFEMLEKFKIPIIANSVGGKIGRKIEYFTGTGDVKHRFIDRSI